MIEFKNDIQEQLIPLKKLQEEILKIQKDMNQMIIQEVEKMEIPNEDPNIKVLQEKFNHEKFLINLEMSNF